MGAWTHEIGNTRTALQAGWQRTFFPTADVMVSITVDSEDPSIATVQEVLLREGEDPEVIKDVRLGQNGDFVVPQERFGVKVGSTKGEEHILFDRSLPTPQPAVVKEKVAVRI